MKFRTCLLLLSILYSTSNLFAQDLGLFELFAHDEHSAFVSLSDVYPLSEAPDSAAIPDLGETDMSVEAPEYFKLDSIYRERFLNKTGLTSKDKLFIYDYSTGVLASFPINKLHVVAKISFYAHPDEWPFSQYDYMIGFEIDLNAIKGFTHTLVYIGKENPFTEKPLENVVWEKYESEDLPKTAHFDIDTAYLNNSLNLGGDVYHFTTGDVYHFKKDGLEYFIQDLMYREVLPARHLRVIDTKSGKVICKRVFCEGESVSLAPLEEQWTGKLFKNKAPVIFGFEYHSFGCPTITLMDGSEYDLAIFCDNRH